MPLQYMEEVKHMRIGKVQISLPSYFLGFIYLLIQRISLEVCLRRRQISNGNSKYQRAISMEENQQANTAPEIEIIQSVNQYILFPQLGPRHAEALPISLSFVRERHKVNYRKRLLHSSRRPGLTVYTMRFKYSNKRKIWLYEFFCSTKPPIS